MATQVWRSNFGSTADQVTSAVGGATTATVEVTVDLTAAAATGLPRAQWHTQVRNQVEKILDFMQKNNPPVF